MTDEIKKEEPKVAKEVSSLQQYQQYYVDEAVNTYQSLGVELPDEGKKCIINAVCGVYQFLRQKGLTMKDIDTNMLKINLQYIGITQLNCAAIPSECYFDLRNTKIKGADGVEKRYNIISIKPQGVGNEKLVRRFGVGIAPDGMHRAWLIREKDDFTYPQYKGLKVENPTWTPKDFTSPVIRVVYPIEMKDGSIEWLIAEKESIKANLIAQIRQNSLYSVKTKYDQDAHFANNADREIFYEKINGMTLDALLADKECQLFINPTYLSGGSRENMFITKMKNNALKQFPKEFDNVLVKEAVEAMFDDQDDSLKVKKEVQEIDATKVVENELDESESENKISDIKVDESTGEVIKDAPAEKVEERAEEPKPASTPTENADKKEPEKYEDMI